MMRLWASSYAKATPVMTSATLSVVAHTIIIGAWVVATLPSPGLPPDGFANRTYPKYEPPPDRSPGSAGSHRPDRTSAAPMMVNGLGCRP